MGFKVGDKVRVIASEKQMSLNNIPFEQFNNGQVFKVTDTELTSVEINNFWFNNSMVESTTPPEKATDRFKAEQLLETARESLREAEKIARKYDIGIDGNMGYGVDNFWFINNSGEWQYSDACYAPDGDQWGVEAVDPYSIQEERFESSFESSDC